MADTLAFWQKTQYYLSGYDATNIGKDHSPASRNPVSYTGNITQPAYYITGFDEGANTTPTNIKVPINNDTSFSFGTGDFTLEGSVYAAYASSIICGYYPTSGNGYRIAIISNKLVFQKYASGVYANVLTSVGTISTSTWYEFAFVRSGGTLKLYLQGVLDSSVGLSDDFSGTDTYFYVGDTPAGVDNQGINRTIFYINKLRITTDDRYTANYTPLDYYILYDFGPPLAIVGTKSLSISFTNTPTYTHMYTFDPITPAAVTSSFGNVLFLKSADALWTQTQLLTHLNDYPTSLDVSLKDRNPATIVGGANVSQGVYYATLINAAPGQIKYPITSGTGASFGTGDFTIEGWFYSGISNQRLIGHSPVSGTGWRIVIDGSGNPLFQSISGGSYTTLLSGGASVNGGWNYFGFQRKAGVLSHFKNGTPNITQISDSTNFDGDGGEFIYGTPPAGENSSYPNATAYYDEIRITSAARYSTGTFTYIANGASQPEGWKVKVIPTKAISLSFNEVTTHATNITLSPDTTPYNISFNSTDLIRQAITEVLTEDYSLSFNDAFGNVVVNNTSSVDPQSYSLSFGSVLTPYSKDQYWDKVVFLSNFNTTTLPIDLSPHNRVLTPFGTTPTYQAGTSSYLTASSGNNGFSVPIYAGTNFDLGTGDFTIESMIADAANGTHFVSYVTPSGNGWRIGHQAVSNLLIFESLSSGVGTILVQAGFNALDWRHIVIQRRGSNFEIYYQGSRVAQVSAGSVDLSGNEGVLYIGGSTSPYETNPYTSSYINIDTLRITKGVARFTTPTITPPAQGANYVVGYNLSIVPTKALDITPQPVDPLVVRVISVDTASYLVDYSLLAFNETYAILTNQVDFNLAFGDVTVTLQGAAYEASNVTFDIAFNDAVFNATKPVELATYDLSFGDAVVSSTKSFFDRSYDITFNDVGTFFSFSTLIDPLGLDLAFNEVTQKEISPVTVDPASYSISFNDTAFSKSYILGVELAEYTLSFHDAFGLVSYSSSVDLAQYDISFYGTDAKEISPLPVDSLGYTLDYSPLDAVVSISKQVDPLDYSLSFNEVNYQSQLVASVDAVDLAIDFNKVGTQAEIVLLVDAYDFSISFNDVGTNFGTVLPVDLVEYSLSFNDAFGLVSYSSSVELAEYTLSFNGAFGQSERFYSIDPLDYSVTFNDAIEQIQEVTPTDITEYSLSFNDVAITLGFFLRTVSVDTYSYSLAYTSVAESIYRNIILPTLDLTLDFPSVIPKKDYIQGVDLVSYSISFSEAIKQVSKVSDVTGYTISFPTILAEAPNLYLTSVETASYLIEYFPSFGVYSPPYLYAPAAKIYIR